MMLIGLRVRFQIILNVFVNGRVAKGIFIHYVWVLELTKRGRPHYHVLFWLPRGISMPKADKQGWWRHGMTNTVPARSPVGYLCKYTSKGIDF